MVRRTSIYISGHYVASINALAFHICTLNSKKISDRIVVYIYICIYIKPTTIRHGVLTSVYLDFIPTIVISNWIEKNKSRTEPF